jgi:hypothetical protein
MVELTASELQEMGHELAAARRSVQLPSLEIETLELKSLDTGRDVVGEIMGGSCLGVRIPEVLSPVERTQLIERLDAISPEVCQQTPWGRCFPKTLIGSDLRHAKWAPGDTLESAYFALASLFEKNGPGFFRFDLNARVSSVLQQLAPGRRLSIPLGPDETPYTPFTFRIMLPGRMGIQTHVGNEFMHGSHECSDLLSQVKSKTQLSYFILLQKPEQGGELVLYDLSWDATPPELIRDEAYARIPLARNALLEGVCHRHRVEMRPGDLLVFDGGRVWHSVEEVRGPAPRITVGGFAAPSLDDTRLHYWN